MMYRGPDRRLRVCLGIFLLCIAGSAFGQPVGSAFTYQGELVEHGVPADGSRDFEFRLFDSETGGSQIGTTQTLTGVAVSEGVFSVSLDFGYAPFATSDQSRWLEIGVRADSGQPWTVLEPRQVIHAAPFALHSEFVPPGSITETEIDTSSVQARIQSACTPGMYMRGVDQAGEVTCESDADGTDAVAQHAMNTDAHHPYVWFEHTPGTTYTLNDYVGINTGSPVATLHVNDADSIRPTVYIDGGGVNEGDLAWPADETFQMGTWDEATTTFSRHVSVTNDGQAFFNNQVYFSEVTGEKISLFGDRFGNPTMYGLGVGDNARLFFKANTGYEFYVGDGDVSLSDPSVYIANGGMGINTTNLSGYRLAVNGDIRSKEIVVETGWSDFVFEPDYELLPLHEVDAFISEHGHLPDIPSAETVAAEGVRVGEMESRLLQKIEELTLYAIDMNERLAALEAENRRLRSGGRE